jgi:hypothetical protein
LWIASPGTSRTADGEIRAAKILFDFDGGDQTFACEKLHQARHHHQKVRLAELRTDDALSIDQSANAGIVASAQNGLLFPQSDDVPTGRLQNQCGSTSRRLLRINGPRDSEEASGLLSDAIKGGQIEGLGIYCKSLQHHAKKHPQHHLPSRDIERPERWQDRNEPTNVLCNIVKPDELGVD